MRAWLRSRRRGVTLVLVTAIGVIVGILALSMVQLGANARILAARNVEGIAARTAADAGIADGVFWMQQKLVNDAVWNESVFPRSVTGTLAGTHAPFSYTISVLTSGSKFQIASTGTCGPATKTITAILTVGSYWTGIGVQNGVDIYPYATLTGAMQIRTNTTASKSLIFDMGVTVPGDVICGPGGNPDNVISEKKTTIIQGDTYAAADPLVFPPVTAPSPTTPMGTMTNTTTISTAGTYQYDSINLKNSAILTITVPVVIYVTGDMVMNNSSEVRVSAGGSLMLYLGGSLQDKNSVGISNATNDPTQLKIYGLPTCTQVDLKAKSTLYAAVYAPAPR